MMPDRRTSLLIADEEDINHRLTEERARLRREAGLAGPRHFQRPRERAFSAEERDNVTILFGGLTWKHEELIKAVFLGNGYKCEMVPVPNVAAFQLGKEYGNNGQCLLQRPSKTFEVKVDGTLKPGVTAKDIILALLARIGVGGGTGCVFEYRGSAIRALSMEQRMTVCNMSIEGGARAGMVAPDDTTFQYIHGRTYAPKGAAWDAAVARWKQLPTDDGARYDKEVTIDADTLEPMITYGTNPGMGMRINDAVPDPSRIADPLQRDSLVQALRYMGLEGGKPLVGHAVDVVFIGSCTNSRISDLRSAASLLKGRKVSPKLRVMVVPGSQAVKAQAEAEGLPKIFRDAGCDYREPGCSMCIAMNGDQLQPGQYGVSTSNRNFEGRQGKGGRTFLVSPLTAAATAVAGVVTDVRTML